MRMRIELKPAELPLTPHPETYCNDVIDLREKIYTIISQS
jgi:hypothetical protein